MFAKLDPKEFAAGEWSELGSRDMDCIGRTVMRPSERERTSHYNLYRYCHNDPVNKSDPTGLYWTVDDSIRKQFDAARAYLSQDPGMHSLARVQIISAFEDNWFSGPAKCDLGHV